MTLDESPTPHGVGGLKYEDKTDGNLWVLSHPTRGGWIEIGILMFVRGKPRVPPHTGWVD